MTPSSPVAPRLGSVRVLALGILLGVAVPAPSVAQTEAGCDLCHGEVEFLRQHTSTLDEAQRLSVSTSDILASAHAEESCSDCHAGYERWPHVEDGTTESCSSCHEEQGALWDAGLHAHPELDDSEPADCASCHGAHAVLTVEALEEPEGIRAMNANCVSCHETQALPPTDPHADSVSCASCHGPHEVLDVDGAETDVAPQRQVEMCGACHEEAAEAYPLDAHGAALRDGGPETLAALEALGSDAPPSCTSCHGGHGMTAVDDTAAATLHVDTCAGCHADEADRYFGTYHGKATALGSKVVATCDDCHGAHGIYASTEEPSWLHEANVVETCATCHEHARPAFVGYDSHPDPMDPERNTPLFLSFVFMNTLLIGVLIVFGLHTALWWVRIVLDHRRSEAAEGSHG